MKKILWTVYIINLLFFTSLFAQEKSDKKLKVSDVKENFMAAEAGFNFSDFNNSTDSQGKFGFLLGLTRNIPLNKYFGINEFTLKRLYNCITYCYLLNYGCNYLCIINH